MKIKAYNIEQMVSICAELVREGMHFEAYEKDAGWVIELSGGY